MTDLFTELTDATTPREAFTVTDTQSATWAMRKLAAIRRREADHIAVADAEIERLTEWAAKVQSKFQREADYFESLLRDYHQRVLFEDERAKTITLPHGKLTYRAQQPEYQRNDDELLAWARVNAPEMVESVERLAWGEIKKRTAVQGSQLVDAESGEVIPGVTVLQREPKFAITIDEGEAGSNGS